MGARKLVGRVRRLIGGAFFYDISDRKTWSRIRSTSKLIQLKALFPWSWSGFSEDKGKGFSGARIFGGR